MYLTLKLIHIISATLLFGTGLGSAFYLYFTYLRGNAEAMAVTNRLVVLADYLFTTPTIIIQLVSGLWLYYLTGLEWSNTWLWVVLGLYLFIGLCWLPVVWLQIKLTEMAENAIPNQALYHRFMRYWLILGLLAFPATLIIYALMIYKPMML